ncbi:response regulator [Brevibacillus ginsengisoli]|uniref:response regulator n=1 Tax=Brevibacillus ginsengisoli TaxID=363854 RepID=UPI003CE909F1
MENQTGLLLVDKDPASLDFLTTCLENINLTLTVDSSYQRVPILEHLHEEEFECVIINMDSPQEETLSLLKEIKTTCQNRQVPLLLVGTEIPLEKKLQYLNYADDLFVLPIEPAELALRVQKHMDRRRKILNQTLVDQLTGAYNNQFLLLEIELQLNDLKRSHEPFTMVYMVIDELYELTKPHQFALRDMVIKGFAEFIQRNIRPLDVLCRYSNDEFILILPKTYKDDAMKLMNRLIRSFSQLRFQTLEGEMQTTFSCRVLEFSEALHTPERCLSMMPFPLDKRVHGNAFVEDGAEELPPAHRKLLIAIIDDDRLIREMLTDQLADLGDETLEIEIRSYPNGEEFFEDTWHRQNQRFLLIVDRVMPKMDGLEILQKIRTEYDRKRYTCLMLTSKDSEADIAFAIQKGANDYVVKPFGLKELRARIRRLIRGSR